MATSFIRYAGDGVTTDFNVTFSYLDTSHVGVKVDGVAVTFTWLTASQIRCTVAPAASTVVEVRRTTTTTPIVDFTDGAVLFETDLDTSSLQAIFLATEAKDALEDTIQDDGSNTWDALSKRITNVADPVDAQDAATKAYADAIGAAVVADAAAAAVSEANAAASAAAASTSAGNAATSETNAGTSETNAAASEAKAAKWAEEAEDVPVETGPNQYSAFHWAQKAASSAGAAATTITYDNTTSGLTAAEVQAAIDELDGLIDTNITDIAANVASLALKAPLASPTFTGTVVVPDQTAADNSTKAANTKYVDAAVAAVPTISKFTSAEQTITAAGSLTIPHGLGTADLMVQARLICKTAEGGYSIGDEVVVNNSINTSANPQGQSIVPDATNLNIRFGSNASTYDILDKTTGAEFNITNANWKLIVKAWA